MKNERNVLAFGHAIHEAVSAQDEERIRNLWAQYQFVKRKEVEQAIKFLRKLLEKQLQLPLKHGRTWSGTLRSQQSLPAISQMIPKSDEATFLREQCCKHIMVNKD